VLAGYCAEQCTKVLFGSCAGTKRPGAGQRTGLGHELCLVHRDHAAQSLSAAVYKHERCEGGPVEKQTSYIRRRPISSSDVPGHDQYRRYDDLVTMAVVWHCAHDQVLRQVQSTACDDDPASFVTPRPFLGRVLQVNCVLLVEAAELDVGLHGEGKQHWHNGHHGHDGCEEAC
jgi:hypothetical protein